MPPKFTGQVSIRALANLDGLGPTEGMNTDWTVPKNVARRSEARFYPLDDVQPSTSPIAWLALPCLILAAGLLIRRSSAK